MRVADESEIPDIGVDYSHLGVDPAMICSRWSHCASPRWCFTGRRLLPAKGVTEYALAFLASWFKP